jgi:uncharacterized protein
MLAGLRPSVILDEWQEVPELLGAVKRSVDENPAPGRYILTGSVRAELENRVWPGTGRLLQIPMYGMSVREVLGGASMAPFIDRVIAGYVEQMITRDVPAVAPRRDPELLRRYLSVLAVNTAGIAAESTLWAAAGINAKTAQAYQALFQRMFVLDLVPAWFSNRIKRLVKAPKRYLVDPALVAAVLGLGRDAILYGPDMLGRLLDTFVAAQLRAELVASSNDPRLYHLREEQGRRAVDLLIETAGGQLIGIEIKAAATVTTAGARHLAWLRDETGDAFAAGVILHTGPHAFPVSDRIVAAPVAALWS